MASDYVVLRSTDNDSTGGPRMSIWLDALTLVAFSVNLATLAWIQTPPVAQPQSVGREPPAARSCRELPGPGAARRSQGAAGSYGAAQLPGAAGCPDDSPAVPLEGLDRASSELLEPRKYLLQSRQSIASNCSCSPTVWSWKCCACQQIPIASLDY